MQIFLTTLNPGAYTISDLGGVTFTHPLGPIPLIEPAGEFLLEDIQLSDDLLTEVTAGNIQLTNDAGDILTNASDLQDADPGIFVHLTDNINETITGQKIFQDIVRIGDAGLTSPYLLSIQDQDNDGYAYIEILSDRTGSTFGGTNKGAFFGMEDLGNSLAQQHFALYNWQGGPITFYTAPTASAGTLRFEIQNDGTLTTGATLNYETLVTADDDIPNKKYVDDAITTGSPPTDLSLGTITATNVPVNSSTGADIATLPAATGTLAGIVTATAQTIGGAKTFANDIITIDSPNSTSDLILGWVDQTTTDGYSLRQSGAGGVFFFMPNADNPQIFLGSENNTTGAAYIDVDNNRPLNLNVLDTGAGTPAVVNIGSGGLNINSGGNITLAATNTVDGVDVSSPINSIEVSGVAYQLVGDAAAPGNSFYYGTNGAGAKGWYTLPAEVNDLTAAVTWANVPDANITQSSVTQHVAAIDHDALLNFVANEHIDWTADQGATNINAANIALALNDLTDTNVPAPPDGSVLAWTGSVWDDTALLRVGTLGCSVRTEDDTGLDWCNYQVGAGGSAFQVMKRAEGTIASPTPLTAGTKIGGIGFIGYDGQAAEPGYVGAQILSNVTETQSATNGGTELAFSVTTNGTKSAFTALTIENDGTLNVAAQTDYETKVTLDDDIPNKKYVDDLLSGIATDMPSVQAKRTTTYSITTTFTDITFNTTDVENDATVVEHDNTNTDRILLKEAGLYWITYSLDIEAPTADTNTARVRARVRANDTGIAIPGSRKETTSFRDGSIGGSAASNNLSHGFYYVASANDFISLQLDKVNIGGTPTVSTRADMIFTAQRCTGARGPQGLPGGGSGDVVGPASATDNAIARYDGTTGKLIQNSTVTISDIGFVDMTANSAGHVLTIRNDAASGELIRGINLNGVEVLQINTGGGGDGIFRIMNNAGVNQIVVEGDTISTDIVSYETNVTADNDIPNKKYVDDAIKKTWTFSVARNAANQGNQYLRRQNGTPTNLVPFVVPVACQIWAVTAENQPSDTAPGWDFVIEVNGVAAYTLAVPATTDHKAFVSGLSVALNAGDEVTMRMLNQTAVVDYPAGTVFFLET